jgi:hypothetical protein
MEHANLVPSLRAALIAAVGSEQIAKRTGKLLARHCAAGNTTGVTVERLRYERGCALWVCFVKPARAIDATLPTRHDDAFITTDTTQEWNHDLAN